MALADVFDALSCARVYKPAFPHEKVKKMIVEGRGSHLDPDVVDAFLERRPNLFLLLKNTQNHR